MVTSPSTGTGTGSGGTTSGSAPATSAPGPVAEPIIAGSSGSALGPVDTGVIDASADRYRRVGEQMQRVAIQAAALARSVPTFGGRPDQTWSTFANQGYGSAAQGAADLLNGAAKMVASLADSSQQLSALFSRTEQQNTTIAGGLKRAFDTGQGSATDSSAAAEETATGSDAG